jgi:1,4-alpha-glucan branching enzyme
MTTRLPYPEQTKVVFTCYAPEATIVRVAGTFNEWSPEATPLTYTEVGEWSAWLMLKPGRYKYRFVVDGIWCSDPRAAQSTPNPYGGLDSVLTVENESPANYY